MEKNSKNKVPRKKAKKNIEMFDKKVFDGEVANDKAFDKKILNEKKVKIK